MLRLKETSHALAIPERSIIELPLELLQQVLDIVEDTCDGALDDVKACSLVCHAFREVALPILFREVHIVGGHRRYSPWSMAILSSPHVLRHIRVLHLWGPTEAEKAQSPSPSSYAASDLTATQVFVAAWKAMTSLSIVHCMKWTTWASTLYDLLKDSPTRSNVEVITYLHPWCSKNPRCLETALSLLLVHTNKLAIGFLPCGFAANLLPSITDQHPHPALSDDERSNQVGQLSAIDTYSVPHKTDLETSLIPIITKSDALEEVWVGHWKDDLNDTGAGTPDITRMILDATPWSRVRRLSFTLDRWLVEFIHILPLLSNLEKLRLGAGLPDSRFGWEAQSSSETMIDHVLGPQNNYPLRKLKRLVDLDVVQYNKLVPLAYVTVPSLRRLSVYRWDRWRKTAQEASNIEQAAIGMPELESLCLEVGYIDKLWNPTAIPGVDVDVKNYSFLNAITKFPKLKFLRLYPPYFDDIDLSMGPMGGNCAQPVSDEQAIRIYNRLVSQQPTLKTLWISATKEFVSFSEARAHDFRPESWCVRSQGKHTILTTRQATKNYEVKQIWVGERKLRTEVKKDRHPRPYLPDFDGWTLQSRAQRQPQDS